MEFIWCDNCGVEMTWSPFLRAGRAYCCQDCAEGVPCRCGDTQPDDEPE